jgi:hypothetical protein
MGKKNRKGGGGGGVTKSKIPEELAADSKAASGVAAKSAEQAAPESLFFFSEVGTIYVHREGLYEVATAEDFEVKLSDRQGSRKPFSGANKNDPKLKGTRMQGQFGAKKRIKP